MHRFFQISELVELVCSHVHPPPDREPTKNARDLVALARTSSFFFSHAIPLIWSSVTLTNLLRAFLPPESLDRDTTGFRVWGVTMRILRPLRDEEFERILIYAPHIKFLFSSYHLDLTQVFQGDRPWFSRNKLPNLRGIHWEHFSKGFAYIEHFLSPRLTTIHIPSLSSNGLEFLSNLANHCPQLKDVAFPTSSRIPLDPGWGMSKINPAVWGCLRGLHFVEKLAVDELDDESLRHVSELPSLRSLKLYKIPASIPTHGGAWFPSLQTLEFSSTDIDQPSRFLEKCISTPLVEFSGSYTLPTPGEAHRLFVAAAGGISHSSMRSFTFYAGLEADPHYESDPSQYIRTSSLRQLFCFADMTRVSILSDVGIELDDGTVEDMARSWRRIERLELQGSLGDHAPRTTVGCLRAFAQYCPKLTWLSITFDARVVPDPLDEELEARSSLETLIVGTSPIGEEMVRPVAEFIASIFPSVKNVALFDDRGVPSEAWARTDPNDRFWREVSYLLTNR